MSRYKVVVYAISKNESSFVERWVDSMKEADEIYVLDTGSTDDTIEKLRSHGVIVAQEIITPWRFDVARNKSLDMVPLNADICVCTDLDEVFERGWRKQLEDTWNNSDRLRYKYNWSIDDNDKPIVTFLYEKIHSRKNYEWIYPVHEILKCSKDNEIVVTNENITLNHYPDRTKSRSSYLQLLELSVKENPNNDRNLHYLGREYMYYGKWQESIDTLIKHINLPTSTWAEERSASMRFISRGYLHLNRKDEAKYWLQRAISESPNQREGYVELAMLELENKNYLEVIINCLKAKTILKNAMIYINEPFCWDSTIDDLLSISYYSLGIKDEALYYINRALELNPNDERLQKNKEIFTS
ncbi:MAG: glycosyl transferase family 2 [Bacilli bacterium]|nr:glycosyl transferase family 2 [Bacilli bacterium]